METALTLGVLIIGRMRSVSSIIAWIGAAIVVVAEEAPDFSWVRTVSSTGANRVERAAADPAGNIYVTGTYTGEVQLGGATLSTNGRFFVGKLDRSGNWVWAREAGAAVGSTINAMWGSGVAVDSASNVVVTGWVNSASNMVVSFGASNVTVNALGVTDEIFVAKYDAAGTLEWARATGGSDPGYAHGIAVDTSNNVLVCGINRASNRFAVLKLDPDGNEIWQRVSASGWLYCRAVAVDSEGNSYVCGVFPNPVIIDGFTLTGNPGFSGFIIKLDPSGAVVWAIESAGGAYTWATDIELDSQTNLLVSGYTEAGSVFGHTLAIPPGGEGVPYVVKLTSAGSNVWGVAAYGDAQAVGVAVDGADQVYAAGYLQGITDFGGYTLTNEGLTDVFVAKYAADGTPQWAIRAGGPAAGTLNPFDDASDIVATRHGVVAVGRFNANPAQFGSIGVSNSSSLSGFVAQINHPTPTLQLETVGGSLQLSWAVFPPDYGLDQALDISGAPGWTPLSVLPAVVNGSNVVTQPMTNNAQFFRLRKP